MLPAETAAMHWLEIIVGEYELLRHPILPIVCQHQGMNQAPTCCGGDKSLGGGGG